MTHLTAPFNVGNTAFILVCASLVMLMTPGLAFFYGGLVGRKNSDHHDAKLRVPGPDNRTMVCFRIFDVFRTKHPRDNWRSYLLCIS